MVSEAMTDFDEPWLTRLRQLQQESITTFLWELVATLQDQEVSVPYDDDRPWQKLLLKLQSKDDAPRFVKDLYFDADGIYLRSRDLVDALQGLQMSASVAAANPTFENIFFPNNSILRTKWLTELGHREAGYKQFVAEAANAAKTLFQSSDPEEPELSA